MPTYECRCGTCDHRFEQFRSMMDAPLKTCPQCGSEVRRLIGAGAGILVKGSTAPAAEYRGAPAGPGCGRDRPCCGREVPCGKSSGNE